MNFIKTAIDGVLILEPKIFADSRGYFYESFSEREFQAGIATHSSTSSICDYDYMKNRIISQEDSAVPALHFVQENTSKSSYGVVRGLHFQRPPFEQSKLVKVVKGRVLDIAVDIRMGSPTFGEHVAVELTEDNHRQLFISRGFAHGFSVLSDVAVFEYKCDNYYAPQYEESIAWDDPYLDIDWKIPEDKIVLSEKDKNSKYFGDIAKTLF